MFHMTSEEQLILDVISKVFSGQFNRKTAQQVLNVSDRTLERYLKGYREKGPLFVKHGNCNKEPINKINGGLKKRVQQLVKDKYYDFNMTHCLEKLDTVEKVSITSETFRRWCHEIDMVKRAKHRRSTIRKHRQRMGQTGLMLQMDGSPHHWFGNKLSCLIAAIDDADSDVPYGEFFPSEDTISCMRVLQKIIDKKGLFHILYVDKAGIFGGGKRSQFSQVKRALKELNIHIIFANSPEGKGRVERLWNTTQDRAIPEMRLRNIKNYEAANQYIQETFFQSEYASKFKVVPANLQTAYRALPTDIDLNEVFCLKEKRTVNRDHTISWNNEIYQIDSPLKYSIYKQKVEIRTYQNLTWKVFFAGKPVKVAKVEEPKRITEQKDLAKVIGVEHEKVRRDEHVKYHHKYYSVDEKYIGKKVSIYEKHNEVLICHKGKLIETHPKITDPLQRCSTKPEHYRGWQKAMTKNSIYRVHASRLGPDVDALVLAIIQQGHGFIDNKSIWGIINCESTHHPAAINEACKSALKMGTPSYRTVKTLLRLIPTPIAR